MTETTDGARLSARVTDIIGLASRMTGVSAADIVSKKRNHAILRIRQGVTYVAHRKCGRTLSHIAPIVGAADHSTLCSSIARVDILISRDEKYAKFIKQLADDSQRLTIYEIDKIKNEEAVKRRSVMAVEKREALKQAERERATVLKIKPKTTTQKARNYFGECEERDALKKDMILYAEANAIFIAALRAEISNLTRANR